MAGSDVQDQDITAVASKSLLLELTDQLQEWKFLGRQLGLTDGETVDIERDNRESKEMKYQTLLQWKQKFGKRATIGKLAEALKKAGRTDLADYVMQEQRIRDAELLQVPLNDNGDPAHRHLLGAEGNGATTPANPRGANVYGDTPRCPLLEGNGATVPANPQGANVYGDTPRCPLLEGNGATTPANPRGANVYGDTPRCHLLEGNGATAPANPQGANDNGDPAHCHLLGAEGNGATAPANPQGANLIQTISLGPSQSGDESARYVNTPRRWNIGPSDQQWQFELEELGGELVANQELSLLATSIAQLHGGRELNDERLFCSQLGIDDRVYNPVLMDRRQSNNEEKLYYVLYAWLMATSLTRNSLCKALLKFDKVKKTRLCKLYVDIVHELFHENSSDSS
ncbi:uncharacterized protein [Apostichopus japonicus]|uniref:uncharacterized protein isoform X3 n=1 Tax=Stichopus japonicus TaxID=307972 RepID=UPI003AB25FC8